MMSLSLALFVVLQAPAFSGEAKSDPTSPPGWTATQEGPRLILRGPTTKAGRPRVAVIVALADEATVPEIMSVLAARKIEAGTPSASEIELVTAGAAVTQRLLSGHLLTVDGPIASNRRTASRTLTKWWKAKGARVWDKRLRVKK